MAEASAGAVELQRRAIERALARGGAAAVREGRYAGTYRVLSGSRDDAWHDVATDGVRWHCSCESRHRPACWHRAAVYLFRLEGAGLRVVGAGRRDARAT